MNRQPARTLIRPLSYLTLLGLAAILGSCSSTTTTTPATPTPTITTYFTQTNLVADVPTTASAAHYDTLLVNPWGMTLGARPWISANGSNSSVFYDTAGGSGKSIGIPMPDGTPGGAPSGIVSKGASSFTDPFIFSTEDGTLAGWPGGTAPTATIVSDSSGDSAVYKGLAMVASQNQIWATDFHNNVINVFNTSFAVVKSFTDPTIPAGYGPFGIANINDTLYVTYARQDAERHDDAAGASTGFVDRFLPNGTMIPGHFASGGDLNSPWGVALAPSTWGGAANAILIGNFGDGRITAFDHNGTLLGQLQSSAGNIISIDGLWAIGFNTSASFDQNKMFFTAGPGGESHGLFGYLHP